jgi:hypothetical protein
VVRPRDFDDVSIHDGIQRGRLAPVFDDSTVAWSIHSTYPAMVIEENQYDDDYDQPQSWGWHCVDCHRQGCPKHEQHTPLPLVLGSPVQPEPHKFKTCS